MGHEFQRGDVVTSTDPQRPLRCGYQWYVSAVVVQEQPLVLVSQFSDMRWESTVKPDTLRKIGRADPPTLAKCLRRL